MKKKWIVTLIFLLLLFLMLTIMQLFGPSNLQAETWTSNAIMIDPGHGGIDGGTQSPDGNVLEKDLNLMIAQQLAQRLRSDGLQVTLTREKDEDVTKYAPTDRGWGRHKRDLYGRVEAARLQHAAIMISIHGNHGTAKNRGAIVFYNPASQGSFLLANELQKKLNAVTGIEYVPKRGSEYYILKQSDIPTVIVEYGYLSNPSEVTRLLDPVYQQQVIDTIRQGIWNYLSIYHSF